MFKIGNVEIKNKVCVAPMAGITDLPYRIILKEMGASLLTTELVSAKGIYYNNPGNELTKKNHQLHCNYLVLTL